MRKFLIFFHLFLVACGGSSENPAEISFSETTGEIGYVQLSLHDSKTRSLSEAAQITHYKIVIQGNNLAPIEKTLSSEAAGVAVEGIPVGKNRKIEIFALNSHEKILREGSIENLTIEPGKVAAVSIGLQSVPVILNLFDGERLSNQRLYFKILTDPGHRVTFQGGPTVSADEKGEAKLYPNIFEAGEHLFTLTDEDSQKSITLRIKLWDGAAIQAAPLFAAANGGEARLGQSLAQDTGPASGDIFFNIAEILRGLE